MIGTKKMCAVIPIDDPSPIAYINVYEEGDIWVKIKGCEECSLENRKKCCGNCVLFTSLGCLAHLEGKGHKKTFYCMIKPTPEICQKFCELEFKCIKGSKLGKIRRVKDVGNIFR